CGEVMAAIVTLPGLVTKTSTLPRRPTTFEFPPESFAVGAGVTCSPPPGARPAPAHPSPAHPRASVEGPHARRTLPAPAPGPAAARPGERAGSPARCPVGRRQGAARPHRTHA